MLNQQRTIKSVKFLQLRCENIEQLIGFFST